MPRYAVINQQNIVVNVIEAYSSFRLPDGFFMVQTNEGDIGNIYIPVANSFDKSNQMLKEIPKEDPKPDTNAWQRFTGAFRRGGK